MKPSRIILLILVLLFVIGLVVTMNAPNRIPADNESTTACVLTDTLTDKELIIIHKAIRDDLLIIEPQYNIAYVDLDMWKSIDIRAKESLCKALAVYCAMKNDKNDYNIHVYDRMSGHELASWNDWRGLQVE